MSSFHLAEKKLPTIEEMSGLIPDFTGGLTLKEYFDEMYEDDYGPEPIDSAPLRHGEGR